MDHQGWGNINEMERGEGQGQRGMETGVEGTPIPPVNISILEGGCPWQISTQIHFGGPRRLKLHIKGGL